jgi:transcriptional regulator with XRE-family HTH domain
MEFPTERLSASELKRIRGRYRLTQKQWAAVTGLSVVSISRWEKGKITQGKAIDVYYRLLDMPEAFKLLNELRLSSTRILALHRSEEASKRSPQPIGALAPLL